MPRDRVEPDRVERHTGIVRFVSPGGDYGFIARDDKQPKVFVHVSAVEAAGFNALEKGQRWRFTIVETEDSRWSAGDLEAAP